MMPPSRPCVLMTADAVGGVWVFATSLARALAGCGYRVHLAVLGPPPNSQQIAGLEATEGVEVDSTDLAVEWLDPEGNDLDRAFDRLAAIERRIRPDLVHLNSFREAIAGWRAPVLVTAHSCVWSWWRACRGEMPAEARWHSYRKHVEAGLAAANMWVAPTEAFRRTIRSIYAPPTEGAVVWNGVELPEAIGAEEKQPVILAAGRLWDEAKNISVLSAASKHIEWPIRIAGPVRGEDGIERRFHAGRLQMLGPLAREAVIAEMQRAAIFAAPARYEPFGLAVLEAAAAGCALLLADIPTFRELWSGAAWFADPADPSAIRAGLERLCGDEALRRSLQQAARQRSRRYSVATMANRYRSLYARLLGADPAQQQPAQVDAMHAGASA